MAALVAMLLRRVPELRTRLGGGPGLQITALTYATPPVVSRNLAGGCGCQPVGVGHLQRYWPLRSLGSEMDACEVLAPVVPC